MFPFHVPTSIPGETADNIRTLPCNLFYLLYSFTICMQMFQIIDVTISVIDKESHVMEGTEGLTIA